MGLKSVLFSGILLSVMAVGVQAKPETGRGLDKSLLPQPVYSPEPGLVDLYWAAWDLAWGRVKHQNGIPQSPYMDENLWDDTIWIWDTEFMVLFCRYAPSLFPGIQSLDNFYKTILDGEPVSLKIWHPDNPPFFAWVEYEYYKMTGDKRRLEYVLEDNRYLQRHFYWFEKASEGGYYVPNPLEAQIKFDDGTAITHREMDGDAYHNFCSHIAFEKNVSGKRSVEYTFEFTDEDYEYAKKHADKTKI